MAEGLHDKLIKEIGNMTILELASFLKELEKKLDISPVVPVTAVTASAGEKTASQADEKSEYKVMLKDIGSEKIKVIKALRKIVANLSLSEAKKMAEEAPTVIVESASGDEAAKIKKELEAVGAKVELA